MISPLPRRQLAIFRIANRRGARPAADDSSAVADGARAGPAGMVPRPGDLTAVRFSKRSHFRPQQTE